MPDRRLALVGAGSVRRRTRTFFALSLLVLAAVLLAGSARAQDPIAILTIDIYERTIAPGQTATFNWTVRNQDIVVYNVTIRVVAASDWQVSLTPSSIVNLAPNRAAQVRVDATAPPQIQAETVLNLQVLFTVTLDGAIVFVASEFATVTLPSIYAEKKVLGFLPNVLPSPLDNEWGVFLLDVILWALIAVAVLLVVIPLVRKGAARTKTQLDDIVIRIVRTPLVILLFLYGTLQSLDVLDRHVDASVRGGLLSIYNAVLVLIIIYLAYRLFRDVILYIGRMVARKNATHLDDVIIPLAEKVGLVVIGLVGLGLFLRYLNVDLTLFVAGGVVISMVVAFAAQDTISNFFSGLFLLADRPFTEGDIVILSDGDWVEVRRIGLRTTRLFRFSDASLVTVPNNKLVNEKIANFTNPRDRGRVMKKFNVGYGSDPAKVKRIIQEAIDATPHVLRDEPSLDPIVRFDALGESSLDFFVLLWIDDRANRFTVQEVLNTEVYTRLTEAGIEIPFPQRTVHVRFEGREGGTAPVDLERIAGKVEAEDSDEKGGK